MPLNIEAIKLKVKKAIMKLPSVVDVYRHKLGDRNEPTGEELVVQLTGLYHKAQNSFISAILAERGETKSRQVEYFMTIIDDDSALVRDGDFFILNDIKYKIVDLGCSQGICYDFALERVC